MAAVYLKAEVDAANEAVPCGKLQGIPGVLQAAGFIKTGTCTVTNTGACASPGSKCTFQERPSGESEKGKCTTVVTKKQNSCVCKDDD